jgi:hypothetical protein
MAKTVLILVLVIAVYLAQDNEARVVVRIEFVSFAFIFSISYYKEFSTHKNSVFFVNILIDVNFCGNLNLFFRRRTVPVVASWSRRPPWRRGDATGTSRICPRFPGLPASTTHCSARCRPRTLTATPFPLTPACTPTPRPAARFVVNQLFAITQLATHSARAPVSVDLLFSVYFYFSL